MLCTSSLVMWPRISTNVDVRGVLERWGGSDHAAALHDAVRARLRDVATLLDGPLDLRSDAACHGLVTIQE